MTQGSVAREFHKFLKTVGKVSDGQAWVSGWDEENVSRVKVDIKPNAGPYKGGQFTFQIVMPPDFPKSVPKIRCETPIFHPNICQRDPKAVHNICLSMFEAQGWQESYCLAGVIEGLLFLLHQPNVEEPFSILYGKTSPGDFEKNVLLSLKGELVVDGFRYPKNYDVPDDAS